MVRHNKENHRMGYKAREYKRTTIRRLDIFSGNECYEPSCTKRMVAEDGTSIVSKICHIRAASPNGPRYDATMDDDQRRDYGNLLLLCDEHHTMIDNKDNELIFTVDLLEAWKQEHVQKVMYAQGIPSSLKKAVFALADLDVDSQLIAEEDAVPFGIAEKMSYNNLVRNRFIIEEYKVFYTRIDAIYRELETAGSFRKERLLKNVRSAYLRAKGKFVHPDQDPLEQLRLHADDIFEEVEDRLQDSITRESGPGGDPNTGFGIVVVMVDAFMRCKILENPN